MATGFLRPISLAEFPINWVKNSQHGLNKNRKFLAVWGQTTPWKQISGMRAMWSMRWRTTRRRKAWPTLLWSSTFSSTFLNYLWIIYLFISQPYCAGGPNEKNHITSSFYDKHESFTILSTGVHYLSSSLHFRNQIEDRLGLLIIFYIWNSR